MKWHAWHRIVSFPFDFLSLGFQLRIAHILDLSFNPMWSKNLCPEFWAFSLDPWIPVLLQFLLVEMYNRFCSSCLFVCLKGWEWERERESKQAPTHWFPPQMPAAAELSQAKARSLELSLPPTWVAGTQVMESLPVCLPRVFMSRKLGPGAEPGLKPSSAIGDEGIPSSIWPAAPHAHLSSLHVTPSLGGTSDTTCQTPCVWCSLQAPVFHFFLPPTFLLPPPFFTLAKI